MIKLVDKDIKPVTTVLVMMDFFIIIDYIFLSLCMPGKFSALYKTL